MQKQQPPQWRIQPNILTQQPRPSTSDLAHIGGVTSKPALLSSFGDEYYQFWHLLEAAIEDASVAFSPQAPASQNDRGIDGLTLGNRQLLTRPRPPARPRRVRRRSYPLQVICWKQPEPGFPAEDAGYQKVSNWFRCLTTQGTGTIVREPMAFKPFWRFTLISSRGSVLIVLSQQL
jgi:hypothetical protein